MQRLTLASLGVLLVASSCSDGNVRVQAPSIDPDGAAAAAIRSYDLNDDGMLNEQELESSPLSLESWDSDGDQQLTAAEIAKQFDKWVEARTGMVDASCSVLYDGVRLSGAEVTYEPEEFLEGSTKPSFGTTSSNGVARMSVAEEFRPHPSLLGAQPGLYKVRIVHPQVKLPAKYNTNTTLYYELSPTGEDRTPTFSLSSR